MTNSRLRLNLAGMNKVIYLNFGRPTVLALLAASLIGLSGGCLAGVGDTVVVSPFSGDAEGPRSFAALSKQISEQSDELRKLYIQAQGLYPYLANSYRVRMWISDDGEVTDVEMLDRLYVLKDFEDSFLQKVRNFHFDEYDGPDVEMIYTFTFYPAQKGQLKPTHKETPADGATRMKEAPAAAEEKTAPEKSGEKAEMKKEEPAAEGSEMEPSASSAPEEPEAAGAAPADMMPKEPPTDTMTEPAAEQPPAATSEVTPESGEAQEPAETSGDKVPPETTSDAPAMEENSGGNTEASSDIQPADEAPADEQMDAPDGGMESEMNPDGSMEEDITEEPAPGAE